MEHILFHLFVETIQAIDRRLQRPLSSVIPDLGLLRADPLNYLANTPIQVGPRRRHAAAAVCGLLAALVVVFLLLLLFSHMPRAARFNWSRIAGAVLSFALVFWIVRSMVLKWMLGGTMTLRAEGAELIYRDRSAFLPWPLFRTPGNIFEPDPKLAVMPIDPGVPVAVSGPGDQLRAMLPAELDLPQAVSSDFGQLAIKDMYEVRVGELAVLLHEIGLRMRSGEFDDGGRIDSEVPLAVPQRDGWLCVQLTQLPFPPYCAACGTATSRSLEVPVVKIGQVNKIAVPYCDECAVGRKRRRMIGAAIGLAVGLMLAIGIASVIAGARGKVELFVWSLVALVPALTVPGVAVGQAIGRDIRLPVRFKEYQPDKGTVRMRMRDPVRAEPLLRAMGLSVVAEPDPEVALN